jgi:phenylpyruvate tautomerase PptA (4-oxalocrotonate tautomerase family)
MPFIRITVLSPELSQQQIERLQSGTTALMVDGMRKPLDGVAVLVDRVERGAWCIGGHDVAVAAEVDAIIGAESNTAQEKVDFMAGMMALLRETLGAGLGEDTYIVIHDMARDSYGRGGLSRAERDRRLAA